MKKVFKRYLTFFLSGILSLLGYSSCSSIGNGEDEYGCPISDFILKGTVTDEQGSPIEGIQVVGKYQNEGGAMHPADTLYTDKNGNYLKKTKPMAPPKAIAVTFTDIDGEAHGGTFKNDSTSNENIEIVRTKKGKGWYSGEFTVTVNKALKKQ
ncbi:putative lipoprotein, rSAM/lipoprotein system [Bacteroidetes bacterium oral taxon 272 str. F0290]|uniref:radical SAM-associated putative lipoprotein n=1 Tax=Phocaeicola abscessus TaxID=555313 RepID=UPI000385B804|nr:radical SAM-associated putative lipoprotein [Phocaeicola abscessus]EPT32848.1 putative lipoprotein, rSAM/lipoprotein system [Bacteroidetes bacterium oral taxon 272 str. F0290]